MNNDLKTKRPSALAEWLLKKIVNDEKESPAGDFEEYYNYLRIERNKASAYFWYLTQIILLAAERFNSKIRWSTTMFKNYLKIAFRNLKKQKFFSFINLTGLALGMAAFILLLLWINDELSFDKFNANKNNIYRIISEQNNSGQISKTVKTPNPLGDTLKKEYPEIINFTRVVSGLIQYWEISCSGKDVSKESLAFADPSFFEIFSYTFLHGDPKTALMYPNSTVITEELAKKCFGNENPIGKEFQVNNSNLGNLVVKGVIKAPLNSHIKFDYIVNITFGRMWNLERWEGWQFFQTYILLEGGSDEEPVTQKIKDVVNKNKMVDNIQISLQPLNKIHLFSKNLEDDDANFEKGDIANVYIFSLTALFVLLIACINFTNLSSARFSTRVKEIGLRKVVGAYRSDIIRQFFGESILLSYLAFLLAVLLVYLVLPVFNDLSSKQLSMSLLINFRIIMGLMLIPLLTGFASGSYPAIFFSSFQPVKVFRDSSIFKANSNLIIRKILVVTQFVVALILIIGTTVIYEQLNYIRNKDLGFNKEHIITFRTGTDIAGNVETIKIELLKNPDILNIAHGGSLERPWPATDVSWEGKNPVDQFTFYWNLVSYNYLKTLGMEMVEGRFFSKELTNTNNFVINESAVKVMGLSSPVGKKFIFRGSEGTIIGVIKDYNIGSLHHKIKPTILRCHNFPDLYIKINPVNVNETIAYIEKTLKIFAGESVPFNYKFLDEKLDNLYKSEQSTGRLIKYYTTLIIFISCLGLFGLASITAIQRKKEIAIRKVLGASTISVNIILSKEFAKWVIISNVISWPVAWFAMNKWLEGFAYKTSINFSTFVLAGMIAFLIAILSVIFQTIKAARTNPAESLACE